MITTTLNLSTVKVNNGQTAVVANLSDGRECWIGESPSIGKRRAIIDVLRAGNGSAIAKSIARLETIEAGILKAQEDAAQADLERAAEELGIELHIDGVPDNDAAADAIAFIRATR